MIRKQKADKELKRQMALEAKELEGRQILEMIAKREAQEKIEAEEAGGGREALAEVLKARKAIQAKKTPSV